MDKRSLLRPEGAQARHASSQGDDEAAERLFLQAFRMESDFSNQYRYDYVILSTITVI